MIDINGVLAIVSPDFSGDSFEDSKRLFPYILEVDTAIGVHSFCPVDFSWGKKFQAPALIASTARASGP